MSTFAEELLADLWEIRAIPGDLGLRIHTVTLIASTWSGAHTGDGIETVVETPIYERGNTSPKVRWLNHEEITIGNLPSGTAEIGPITPDFPGGGTVFSQFGTVGIGASTGETVTLKIVGPEHPTGALYRLVHIHKETPLHISLKAAPVAEVSP